MARAEFSDEDDELLAELGVEVAPKTVNSRTPREERIIAGFEEIERFIEQHGRLPQHGEDHDIFERLYAVRLDQIRASSECKALLTTLDKHGLLTDTPSLDGHAVELLDDDALLAQLGVTSQSDSDMTQLKHVKSRAEKKAAEEIGSRSLCHDFETFKPLFAQIQTELKAGVRKTLRFKEDGSIQQNEFFIVGGQMAYIAEIGKLTQDAYGKWDGRLRIIFDNGTESNILLRSLHRALYKDEAGRRVSDPNAGPLFEAEANADDIESGTIYVLRSKSEQAEIKQIANVLHKIGVTGGEVEKRIANAKVDPTFLMAEVEIVATYDLYNINRIKLENLIHRFLEPARLDIAMQDRMGVPVKPREWFLIPLNAIEEMVDKIQQGTLANYRYDPTQALLTPLY